MSRVNGGERKCLCCMREEFIPLSEGHQGAVEESFPHNVLLADDPKLHVLCSCLGKYFSNTAHCNKWVLNDLE